MTLMKSLFPNLTRITMPGSEQMILRRTKRIVWLASINQSPLKVTAGLLLLFVSALTTTTARAQGACTWQQEQLFVIPGTIGDAEEKALEKLLDELVNKVGGAIPQVGAVKTAIDKLGPGGDTVEVVVIYKCTDKAGKVRRRRDTLDLTESDLWAAKMNLVSGAEKLNRDRMRQRAIDNHKPKTSCCPPNVPPAAPGGAPDPVPPKPASPQPPAVKDPCKVPSPCAECKNHHDKIAASCDRIKEIDDELINRIEPQLKPRVLDVKTATGAVLKRLEREIAELNSNKQKLSAEKAGLQTQIKNDTAAIKECERTSCNPTITGGLPVRGFDRCLVGTWRSVLATSEFNHWANGGEGVIFTIGGDGQAAIDYSRMQPNVRGNNTRTWGGGATGRLTSVNNTLMVKGATFDVTVTYTGPGQPGVPRSMTKNGLGNLLQEINDAGAQSVYRYTCDATTLVITGFPWSSTFKRVGSLP